MALETVVFQQDPFSYSCNNNKDYYFHNMEEFDSYNNIMNNNSFGFEEEEEEERVCSNGYNNNWDSSPEFCAAGGKESPAAEVPAAVGRRKRRRTKCSKNKEEIENQRMNHIEVERNRRRQMNDYLTVLRSLMPPSYAQRGDQASIVGGAINFVKELEQLSQFLEAHKLVKNNLHYNSKENSTTSNNNNNNNNNFPFSNFFHFPQYSTSATRQNQQQVSDRAAEKCSGVADIEVAMVENHANVKVLSRKRPKQLSKMVSWFHAMCLTILHLNATTIDQMVLYSFSVKVEEECRLSTVNEIATSVHDMVAMIEQHTTH